MRNREEKWQQLKKFINCLNKKENGENIGMFGESSLKCVKRMKNRQQQRKSL